MNQAGHSGASNDDEPMNSNDDALDATIDFPGAAESSLNSFGETILTPRKALDPDGGSSADADAGSAAGSQSGSGGNQSSDGEGASVDAVKQFGKFEVRGLLGRGAFGKVYRGYDPQLDREVAIKVPVTDQGECNCRSGATRVGGGSC